MTTYLKICLVVSLMLIICSNKWTYYVFLLSMLLYFTRDGAFPIFTLLISIAQVLVFFGFYWMEGKNATFVLASTITDTTGTHIGLLEFEPTLRFQIWRFWQTSLIHAGFPHMIDNVWPQFRIGYQLERKQGHWRVALCHTMGVLAGEKYLHELTTSIFTFIHYKMRNFVS
ncbi:hypothetical protein PRIPAC_95657 [Pristionchus pacificus]|uniref:Rhomboid-like protein n=1 Tax=Pristionchus pacificus TaxID=54126 RepID=A0A2A6D0T7_PRIPA|nr:hypothetical protein PRIPAC_95657 [Pristionchus pacificus]|eukprot:PDM84092.1 hypothetical protein PRIPAC_34284 [Pristionchus pacificus]